MSEESHSIRFVPYISSNSRSLYFEAFEKEFTHSTLLKVGRSTERLQPAPDRLAFKSKVVSRSHAEIWLEKGQVLYFMFII